MMLIWRSILLMAVVWLMLPPSAQASPPLALETTIPLQRVVIFGSSNPQTTGVFFSMDGAAVARTVMPIMWECGMHLIRASCEGRA